MYNSLVSVLMPVYNVEPYIEEAVRSILGQTYKNLELIIVDDASTDNTYSVAGKLQKLDSRIRLFKNSRNLKIAQTLNIALSQARGNYIARMDGDDISEPDRIARKVSFLENNPDYALVGCSIKSIDTCGNIIGQATYYANQKILRQGLKFSTPVAHIWVARKEVYDRLQGYRDISGVEDYDFLLRLTTAGYRYSNLEHYFGYYARIGRKGNTTTLIGSSQIRLHAYAFKLFRERQKYSHDSFSPAKVAAMTQSNPGSEGLYKFAARSLCRAIQKKNQKNYLGMLIYLLFALLSPAQLTYLYRRFRYRLIIRKYSR